MRILLINPPYYRLQRVCISDFPLSLGYIAGVLEKDGHFVRIYNADKGKEEKGFHRISNRNFQLKGHENFVQAIKSTDHYVWKEVRQRIVEFCPDLVGIQALTPTFASTKIVARITKELNNEIPVVVGGVHPTTVPEEVISDKNIDFAVCGEGEITIVEFARIIQKGTQEFFKVKGLYYKDNNIVRKTPPREFITDLDKLPFPARHLVLNPELYTNDFGALIMGRGCPFSCTFCASNVMWARKVRTRSPSNIVEEMRQVKDKYGVRSFAFQDDTLTFDRKRLNELCRLLIDAKLAINWMSYSRVDVINEDSLDLLKKSGCCQLSFGIESGSERILKIMKKQINLDQILKARKLLKKYGIMFSTIFLIGTPDETKQDLLDTIEFIKKLRPDLVNICTYTPYLRTEMYERAVELGTVSEELDYLYLSHHSARNTFSKFMTLDDFVQLRIELVNLADLMSSRISLIYLRSMLRLWLQDPKYFAKRFPYYISVFPNHLKKAVSIFKIKNQKERRN